MKNLLLLFSTFFFTISINSQITFENGYFIDNSGKKTDCLIKNYDWNNNPTNFEYKVSESGEIKIGNLISVKEFSVNNILKYVRASVKIDKSSEKIEDLNYEKEPVFVEETVFLKVLVEGKSNLYIYQDNVVTRFFYLNNNASIEQLVYKKYLGHLDRIAENEFYKRQLWNSLKCPTIPMKRVENLEYKKSSLVSFFIEFNKCGGGTTNELTNFEEKTNQDLINVTPKLHLNNSSLNIENFSPEIYNTNFDNQLSIGFGVELEFILPFNKNKWSLFIEPTYQYFKSEKTTNISSTSSLKASVDYSSIELPVGVRHYLFLNKNSKLFINAAWIFDIPLNKSLTFQSTNFSDLNLDLSRSYNILIGSGFKWKDKYSIEMRYLTSRDLLNNYVNARGDYNALSIILGYSFF